MRLWRRCILLLLGTTLAFGGRLSFQEHAAVQESLAPVHDAEFDSRYSGLTMF